MSFAGVAKSTAVPKGAPGDLAAHQIGTSNGGRWAPLWRPPPRPTGLRDLLGFVIPALVVIVTVGWGSGLLISRLAGQLVMAHVDGPAKEYFARHQQHGVASAMATVTQAGSDRVAATAAIVIGLAWWTRRRSWIGLQAMTCAYLGGTVITVTVKTVVGRGHPVGTGLSALSSSLYPSGHAICATSVYGMAAALAVLALGRRRPARATVGAAGLVVVAVGFALLYVAAHLLTDVIAGVVLAASWVGAVAWVVGSDWTTRASLAAVPAWRPGPAGTAPRVGTWLAVAAGAALFVAVAFAAVGTRQEARGPSARAIAADCAPPLRKALGDDASVPLPGLARACAASTKGQLVTSGGLIAAAFGLSLAGIAMRRRPTRRLPGAASPPPGPGPDRRTPK